MVFFKLLHELVKLIHGFLKVAARIRQSCSLHFSLFAKQNQAEVWPRVQSLLKLLLWPMDVDWVNVLNASGQLCLWRCFFPKIWQKSSFQCMLTSKNAPCNVLVLCNISASSKTITAWQGHPNFYRQVGVSLLGSEQILTTLMTI